jgi:methyl-accepting chemotaxis protein
MEGTFIEFLNSILPGLGIGLSVVVVLGGFILKGYKALKKQIADHDAEILKKAEEGRVDSEFKDEMLQLAANLKNMNADFSSTIDNLNQQMEVLSKTVSEIKESSDESDATLVEKMNQYETRQEEINAKIDAVHESMNLLIESDKESIRSFITLQYYECQEKGYIEVYVLQALEDRYEKYLIENGDSFIANLVKEMRKLPHVPPTDKT